MTNAEAEAAKGRGNTAMKDKKYDVAIAEYTKAIEIQADAGYYGNRSMAYLRSGSATKALEDADEAIRLKRDGTKGYTRKGDALMRLQRFQEAVTAFDEAVKCDASNAKAAKKAADCRAWIRGQQARAWANHARAGAGLDGNDGTGAVGAALHLFIMLACIGYMVPTALSYTFYYGALKMGMMVRVQQVLRSRGRPQLNLDYWKGLLTHPAIHRLFPCLVFLFAGRPVFVALLPNAIWSVICFSRYVKNSVPAAYGVLKSLFVDRVLSQTSALHQLGGRFDVGLGFVLLAMLLTPYRSFLSAMMYWQFLQLQCMLPQQMVPQNYIKSAFAELGAWLDGKLLGASWCPGIVQSGYLKLKGLLAGMVDPEAARQRPSMMSMCSIM